MRYPNSFTKRAFDAALALPLVVVAVPVCAVLMLLVRLESAGSPLFVQRRVGRDGRIFAMPKIRTMYQDAPSVPSHHIGLAKVTRSGAWLRRLKLDELPQALSVLRGDMSFVGPRPCLPTQDELIAERAARGVDRLSPGITGPGQVAGVDMSTPARLAEIEAQYFSNATFTSDLKLMAQTVFGGGRGDAARGTDGQAGQ